MEKAKRTRVLLAIGEQERESQNPQVLSISSNSGDKRTYVWEKAKRTCVISAIGEQERQIQNPQVLSISSKSGDKIKKGSVEARALARLALKKGKTLTRVNVVYFYLALFVR